MSSFAPASKRARVEQNFDYPPGREFFPGAEHATNVIIFEQ